MISYPSLASADPTWTLYFFENRMKKLLKDPKNFRDFSDEQMDILENTVLPAVATLLEQQTSEVPAGHA